MRGKLPRSWKINETDPLYSTKKLEAFLYDSSLAMIATAGTKKASLATEIANGILLSASSSSKFPFLVNSSTGAATSTKFPNSTLAIASYALGYYLEMNPTASNYCAVETRLINCLEFLQTERDWLYSGGLIYEGYNGSTHLKNTLAETNLIAFFAFKQAAKVLNNDYYENAAYELQTSIVDKLWVNEKINNGLSDTGVIDPTNTLQANAYAAIFFMEINEKDKALECLSKCEVFSIVDQNNGAVGYTGFLGTPDNVWFELSYLVAIGYHRAGNLVKYNQIVNELNKYVDTTDGGIKGGIVKDYLDEIMIGFKSVGSTACSIIANILKSSAFKIRTTESPVSACTVPFYNDLKQQTFTKSGCTSGYNPSTYTYVVPKGRYASYTSLVEANNLALAEISTFGQAYTDLYGQCIPEANVGNDFQSGTFTKNNCAAGYHGSSYTTNVEANTYYASTKEDANLMASNYIFSVGQSNANTYGSCIPDDVENYIYAVTTEVNGEQVDVRIYSSMPVNTNVTIQYVLIDGSGTIENSYTSTIYNGDSSSTSRSRIPTNFVAGYNASITNVTPAAYGNMTYTFG